MEIYEGDCLEVMRTLKDGSIDMVLTDPPYGTTACKWDSVVPFEPMWKELKRVRKDNAAICLFGSEPFSSHLRMSNIKEFKYDWIWRKTVPSNIACAKFMPLKYHELISTFYLKPPSFYGQKIKRDQKGIDRVLAGQKSGKPFLCSAGNISTTTSGKIDPNNYDALLKNPCMIIDFKSERGSNRYHPTQKPVALLEYLIKTYTIEGETVLDFTMGGGSTGVACKNLNRKFIGIEKDAKYFKIAEERLGIGDAKLL
jgi:site-specific DNA-methyltransferase (adenine-specific)